jgi:predicted RNase H-like nuclease (RuvC/YqgF family)
MWWFNFKQGESMNYEEEIKRLNEKIEFLSRTNMLYSDWEHRDTQVTSDLIRKGIEEHKINAELRAEIAELRAEIAAEREACAKLAEQYGPNRPIVAVRPSERIRGRWEGEQAASSGISAAIRARGQA